MKNWCECYCYRIFSGCSLSVLALTAHDHRISCGLMLHIIRFKTREGRSGSVSQKSKNANVTLQAVARGLILFSVFSCCRLLAVRASSR
jgi:hypothetical protein